MAGAMLKPASRCIIRGSINNDEYFYVKDISKPGETISSTRYESRVGGKGANQAVAIMRAGGHVEFYGTVGRDGVWVRDRVGSEFGLDTSGIIVSEGEVTGRAIIQVSSDGENSIVLFPGANHSLLHEEKQWFHGVASQKESKPTHILLQNEVHFDATLGALNLKSLGDIQDLLIAFNPSPLPTPVQISQIPWHNVDWLIINEGEAEGLLSAFGVNRPPSQESIVHQAKETILALGIVPALGNTNVICTLGPNGVLACLPRRRSASGAGMSDPTVVIHCPAAQLRGPVVDTTGAGDCFTGYFIEGLMELGSNVKVGEGIERDDLIRILKKCVEAAAICVERQGTIDSIPLRAEVEARMAAC